jgi:N-acyl-L-homoserine lactone synthetase
MSTDLIFKIATEPEEFEQIHRLNYRTFVEEIPQHPANSAKRQVDRFHSENSYVICRDGARLIGMLALQGNRPFSLDSKVPDLDAHLPKGAVVCELRLLAVEPEYRRPGPLPG